MNIDEIKKALEDHSIEKLKYQDGIKIKEIDFISILTLINELEREIEQLTRELAKEQEACVECELEQSWELFVRDKEIDRLRAEIRSMRNETYKDRLVANAIFAAVGENLDDKTPYS